MPEAELTSFPAVIDGGTIVLSSTPIHIAGIDAPDVPEAMKDRATFNLRDLIGRDGAVTCSTLQQFPGARLRNETSLAGLFSRVAS